MSPLVLDNRAALHAPRDTSCLSVCLSMQDLPTPLPRVLIAALYVEMHYSRPSQIQADALPMLLWPPHKDLIAQAQNGSGKTTCYVLALLSR